jgi:hypothetical protein
LLTLDHPPSLKDCEFLPDPGASLSWLSTRRQSLLSSEEELLRVTRRTNISLIWWLLNSNLMEIHPGKFHPFLWTRTEETTDPVLGLSVLVSAWEEVNSESKDVALASSNLLGTMSVHFLLLYQGT